MSSLPRSAFLTHVSVGGHVLWVPAWHRPTLFTVRHHPSLDVDAWRENAEVPEPPLQLAVVVVLADPDVSGYAWSVDSLRL